MEITVQATHLKAAMLCAAVHDVRYYLRGVFVESNLSEVRCVGTDGNLAGVCRDKHFDVSRDVFSVIIPIDTVKLALAGKSQVLGLSCIDGQWKLGAVVFTPVDGKYPDYRRVIPTPASGEAAHFQAEFIATFAKVGKALGCKSDAIIRQNGNGGAQVQFYGCDEFVGVIMPMRMFNEKRPDQGLITWGSERTT